MQGRGRSSRPKDDGSSKGGASGKSKPRTAADGQPMRDAEEDETRAQEAGRVAEEEDDAEELQLQAEEKAVEGWEEEAVRPISASEESLELLEWPQVCEQVGHHTPPLASGKPLSYS